MSDASNAVLALKNAWSGVVNASDAVRAKGADVQALPLDAGLDGVDLAEYHRLTAAQANAVMALRGLIEELQRRRDGAEA